MAILFFSWQSRGSPHLPCMETGQRVAYISDCGAYDEKWVFVAGTVIAILAFQTSYAILIDWIFHYTPRKGHKATADIELGLTVAITVLSTLAAMGGILLTLFDKASFQRAHQAFLGFFL